MAEEVAWKGYEPKSPEARAAAEAYEPPEAIIEEAPDIEVEEVGKDIPIIEEAPPVKEPKPPPEPPEEEVEWKPPTPEMVEEYVPPEAIIEEAPPMEEPLPPPIIEEAPPVKEPLPPPVIEEYPEVVPIPTEAPPVLEIEPVIPEPPFRIPYGAKILEVDAQDRPTAYEFGGKKHYTPYNLMWYEYGYKTEEQYSAPATTPPPFVPIPSPIGQDTPKGKITLVPREQAIAIFEKTGEEQFKALQGAGVIPYGSKFVPGEKGYADPDWQYVPADEVEKRRGLFFERFSLDSLAKKLPLEYQEAYANGGLEGLKTYASAEVDAFVSALSRMPQEAQDAYKEGGFEAYDKWREQWETEHLFIDDYIIPIAVWNELLPEYQSIALNEGIPKLNEVLEQEKLKYEKQKAEQDTALNALAAMGYRTTREEYPFGLAPFELYETAKDYDIWQYIQDKPNQNSILLLEKARYSQETIDAAQTYVNEVQKAIALMDAGTTIEAIRRTGDIEGVEDNALGRAIRKQDIPIIYGDVARTWQELAQGEKEKVITEYMNDLARRNIFAGMTADLMELRDHIKGRILASTATITPEGLRGGLRATSAFATEASLFFPIILTGIADILTEDIKQIPDYTKVRAELEWVNPRTGKVISTEEYEALGDSIELDDYRLTAESIDKLAIVRLPKQFAQGTAMLFKEGIENIPKGGYETGAGLATVGLMLLPFAKTFTRFKPLSQTMKSIKRMKAEIDILGFSEATTRRLKQSLDNVVDATKKGDAEAIRKNIQEVLDVARRQPKPWEMPKPETQVVQQRLLNTAEGILANADALAHIKATTVTVDLPSRITANIYDSAYALGQTVRKIKGMPDATINALMDVAKRVDEATAKASQIAKNSRNYITKDLPGAMANALMDAAKAVDDATARALQIMVEAKTFMTQGLPNKAIDALMEVAKLFDDATAKAQRAIAQARTYITKDLPDATANALMDAAKVVDDATVRATQIANSIRTYITKDLPDATANALMDVAKGIDDATAKALQAMADTKTFITQKVPDKAVSVLMDAAKALDDAIAKAEASITITKEFITQKVPAVTINAIMDAARVVDNATAMAVKITETLRTYITKDLPDATANALMDVAKAVDDIIAIAERAMAQARTYITQGFPDKAVNVLMDAAKSLDDASAKAKAIIRQGREVFEGLSDKAIDALMETARVLDEATASVNRAITTAKEFVTKTIPDTTVKALMDTAKAIDDATAIASEAVARARTYITKDFPDATVNALMDAAKVVDDATAMAKQALVDAKTYITQGFPDKAVNVLMDAAKALDDASARVRGMIQKSKEGIQRLPDKAVNALMDVAKAIDDALLRITRTATQTKSDIAGVPQAVLSEARGRAYDLQQAFETYTGQASMGFRDALAGKPKAASWVRFLQKQQRLETRIADYTGRIKATDETLEGTLTPVERARLAEQKKQLEGLREQDKTTQLQHNIDKDLERLNEIARTELKEPSTFISEAEWQGFAQRGVFEVSEVKFKPPMLESLEARMARTAIQARFNKLIEGIPSWRRDKLMREMQIPRLREQAIKEIMEILERRYSKENLEHYLRTGEWLDEKPLPLTPGEEAQLRGAKRATEINKEIQDLLKDKEALKEQMKTKAKTELDKALEEAERILKEAEDATLRETLADVKRFLEDEGLAIEPFPEPPIRGRPRVAVKEKPKVREKPKVKEKTAEELERELYAEEKPVAKPTPKPEPRPVPTPAPIPEPRPFLAPVISKPLVVPEVTPEIAPVPEPVPAPVPEPVPAPVPEPVPAPVPEPVPAPVPEPVPAPVPEPVPAPVPELITPTPVLEKPPPIPPPIMWKSEIPDEWRATGVPAGTITWRQGMKWMVIPPPYRDEDMMALDHPLPGTTKFAVGKGSARKTLQILGGRPPVDADVDMGWAQIHISSKDGKMDIRFGGGQEAAEERWAMEREYMDELDREAYEGIPKGLVETSRIPRTRARLPLEDAREIYPPEEVVEGEPLSETELLLRQIERGQARREASRMNVPRIGDRHYNEEDMIYVPPHYRRRNGTPIVEESGIKLPTRTYLGRRLRSSSVGTGV